MGESGNLTSFISVIDFATVLALAHQFKDLFLHLLTVPSKADHIEHLIYRILSHVVAFPPEAHHFPPATGSRDLGPRTASGSSSLHIARRGLSQESNICGSRLLGGAPRCRQQQERLGICHSIQWVVMVVVLRNVADVIVVVVLELWARAFCRKGTSGSSL